MMAVVFKSFDSKTGTQEEIGVYYNGEFTGKVTLEIQLRRMGIENEDSPEDILVKRFDSYALQAIKVDDDSVTVSDFERDYVDADIDPDDYM